MSNSLLTENISDEILNCFVDNELDTEEHQQILQAQLDYPSVHQRICNLRHLKQLTLAARPLSQNQSIDIKTFTLFSMWKNGIAAAVILFIMTGVYISYFFQLPDPNNQSKQSLTNVTTIKPLKQNTFVYSNPLLKSAMTDSTIYNKVNVIFHISKNIKDLDDVLNDINKALIDSKINNKSLQIEVITSGSGLHLLDALPKDNLDAINKLYTQYGNISFLVCQKTLNKYRQKTKKLRKIPKSMLLTKSSADLIKLRRSQGWRYIPI